MEINAKQPSVAVVILNWNGRAHLERFLPSVLATNYSNYMVVVADNGSTDQSVEFVRNHFPTITIVELGKNFGFAEGYNKALRDISADYLVLLNSDVEVTPDWLSPVIELMQSDSRIAACQPKILSLADRTKFEYAGAAGGWIDKYGFPFCRGRVFDHYETDHGQYNDVSDVFWASGACLFVRPEAFWSAGGFDPTFFAHQEEIDLCWRMQHRGGRICVQPRSVVYHLGGGSLEMGSTRKVYLNYRNNLMMLQKNLKCTDKFWRMFVRMSMDGLAAFQFLFQGRGGSFFAILRAHGSFYGWLLFGKKSYDIDRRRFDELTGVYGGSIVWEFFVRKKKTFEDIVKKGAGY